MILYGTSLSPFVRKVLVALAEKGLAYDHVPVRFHDPDADFQAASPLGKIPAIDDDGFHLADSSAIVHYLERLHPSPALLPAEPRQFARAIWFDKFGDTELFPVLIQPFVHRVVRPKLMNLPGDESAVEKALTQALPKLCDHLEAQIDGPFLVGDAFGLADIAVATGFANFRFGGEKVDAERWPKLAAWVETTLEWPSFKAALAARKQ